MSFPSRDRSEGTQKHEEVLDTAALEELGVYDDVSRFDRHVAKLQKIGGRPAELRSHGYESACSADMRSHGYPPISSAIPTISEDVMTASPRLLGGPGFLAKRKLKRPSAAVDSAFIPMEICVENTPMSCEGEPHIDFFKSEEMPPSSCAARWSLCLKTPSSCSSCSPYKCHMPTPCTPEANREDLTSIEGDVRAIIFDFDGTLTASPGEVATRGNKQDELCKRSSLLEPRLRALREAGIMLGIMSKSSEMTIRSALREAGLSQFFNGPLVAKAVGFEGKAGFIKELVQAGDLGHLEAGGLGQVLLVDDDIYELDRAIVQGIQTYAVPESGGLQDKDFDQIFVALGLPVGGAVRSTSAHSPSTIPCVST